LLLFQGAGIEIESAAASVDPRSQERLLFVSACRLATPRQLRVIVLRLSQGAISSSAQPGLRQAPLVSWPGTKLKARPSHQRRNTSRALIGYLDRSSIPECRGVLEVGFAPRSGGSVRARSASTNTLVEPWARGHRQ
jgi:hypothetical protein